MDCVQLLCSWHINICLYVYVDVRNQEITQAEPVGSLHDHVVQLDETSKRLAPPKFFRLGLHTKAVIPAMPFKAEPPRLCGPLGRGFSNGLTTSSTELFCRQMLLAHLIHPPSPHHAPTHPHPTQIRAHSLYGCEHIPYLGPVCWGASFLEKSGTPANRHKRTLLCWGGVGFAGVPDSSRNRAPQQTGSLPNDTPVCWGALFLEKSDTPANPANFVISTFLTLLTSMRAHS